MNNMKKTLLICVCIIAVLGVAVAGTLAYLTSTDRNINTFTVGKVNISVDEAKVDTDGVPVPGADRVKQNSYHLIPGQSYVKDPTMTVKAESEQTYVRMMVTLNCKSQLDAIFAPNGMRLDSIFKGWDSTAWEFFGQTEDAVANTVTLEFRYKTTVDPDSNDVVLEPLFDSFEVPGQLDGEDLEAIKDLTITVDGHAVQAKGFADADVAWAAFDVQQNH